MVGGKAPRRGDVVWAQLEPTVGHEQRGHRPVVVLSADVFNAGTGTVVAAVMTSQPQRAPWPLSVEVSRPVGGKRAWIKPAQVRTLSVRRLTQTLDHLDEVELGRLVAALNEVIGASALIGI